MMDRIPHLIPYQGSKRKLAERILDEINFPIDTFYEPFAGSAAITLAAIADRAANKYVISDKLEALAGIWQMVAKSPTLLADQYETFWNEQTGQEKDYFNKIRDRFNKEKGPAELLFLIARCVKNSIRFNSAGEFNQGPDNRRRGMSPKKVRQEALRIHHLLKGKATIMAASFQDVLVNATSKDFVYMDPPWQGTSNNRDPRYAFVLNLDELVAEMERLNAANVPFVLSFDGECGNRSYGKELPSKLDLTRVALKAGRSSQATLLGRSEITIESLYLSPAVIERRAKITSRKVKAAQPKLFASEMSFEG